MVVQSKAESESTLKEIEQKLKREEAKSRDLAEQLSTLERDLKREK